MTSTAFAVAVMVGAVPPAHLTDAGQVTVLPPVASCVSTMVDPCAVPDAGGFVNAMVVFSVRETVNTFPSLRSMVVVPELDASETCFSRNAPSTSRNVPPSN